MRPKCACSSSVKTRVHGVQPSVNYQGMTRKKERPHKKQDKITAERQETTPKMLVFQETSGSEKKIGCRQHDGFWREKSRLVRVGGDNELRIHQKWASWQAVSFESPSALPIPARNVPGVQIIGLCPHSTPSRWLGYRK